MRVASKTWLGGVQEGKSRFFSANAVREPLLQLISFQAAGFANYVAHFGQEIFLLRRREWDWGVERSKAHDGPVEVVESFFIDNSGDFAGEAAGAGVLVKDDDLIGLLHRAHDCFAIERRYRAEVNNFYVDSLFSQGIGSVQGGVNHSGVGNDAEIAA